MFEAVFRVDLHESMHCGSLRASKKLRAFSAPSCKIRLCLECIYALMNSLLMVSKVSFSKSRPTRL